MYRKPWTRVSGLLLVLTMALYLMEPAWAVHSAPVDPIALVKLRAVSSRLSAMSGYRFVVDTTLDDLTRDGIWAQYSNRVDVTLLRPDRLFARVHGDLHDVDLWYDGRALTKVATDENCYATLKFKGGVEQMLDVLAQRYDAAFPLADFLVDDLYKDLTLHMRRGSYEGIHLASGVPCHHLVFATDKIDWQIWITTGGEPTPKKIVLTYKMLPGHPRYSATFLSWEFNPTHQSSVFTPRIPESARRVEFSIGSRNGSNSAVSSLYR